MLDDLFREAFSEFLTHERGSILDDVSERNLCGRLACHLEAIKSKYGLDAYYADTEYNRKQEGAVKTILDDEMKEVTIVCDLIVHSRGKFVAEDNLIAIEMKKATRPAIECVSDRNRLRALTKASYDGVWSADGIAHPEHVCGYKLGLFIELDIRRRTFIVECFQDGNRRESGDLNGVI